MTLLLYVAIVSWRSVRILMCLLQENRPIPELGPGGMAFFVVAGTMEIKGSTNI